MSCLTIAVQSISQFYYRGELMDDRKKLIPNATIYMHSNKMVFSAGSSGSFGLMSTKPIVDTFTIICEGFEALTIPVYSDRYNNVKMNLLASVASLQKNRLASITKDLKRDQQQIYSGGNETYSDLIENDFIDANQYPVTGFAVNSDRASYSNIRRFINLKSQVPFNAVRIDEMINYFNFPSVIPEKGKVFKITSQLTQCPWNLKNLLLYINVTAQKLDLDKIPPSNLVFLIDNSGSMELQNRMPLLKSAFKLLVKNLREKDYVTIITYGGQVNVALEATSGKYQDSIIKIIEEMDASGDTPGESAIKLAYQKAKQSFIKDGNNRVILATDGDFNVGIADEAELQRLISLQSQSGIYLTCLGVGMGNYKDSKLEILAKKGKGNFAYIDNEREGEKVLVQEMTQTLYSVADNTFMDIQFDDKYVGEYRLIGFDNKKNAIADSTSKLDGGQVGSGYTSIVLFEIEPTATINFNNLDTVLGKKIAQVQIAYENPKNNKKEKEYFECVFNYQPLLSLPKQYGFATAVAMFGSYVKESKYTNNLTLDEIKLLAMQSLDPSNNLQVEFVKLVDKAKPIYEVGKKKKKRKNIF